MADTDIENEEDDPWADALGEQAEGEGKDPDAYLNNEGEEPPAAEASSEEVDADAGLADAFGAAGLSELVDESAIGEGGENVDLNMILDIPVTISMEIGRTQISIRNLLKLNQGSVVELDRLAGEPLDVLVNGTLIAHGEVVVVNEKFGIRLTDVITALERVQKLT